MPTASRFQGGGSLRPSVKKVFHARSNSSAVIVSDVQADTPAAEAGLTTGDTILNLDGQEVRTRAELSDVLDTIEPGTTVQITWTTASGRERTAPITPKASPLN